MYPRSLRSVARRIPLCTTPRPCFARLNELHYPTHVVLLAVLWRLRYKLGFRDVAELLLQRGYEVTHETIRGWEARFAPLLGERLRARRRGQASRSWYIDETYLKVAGRWCYLYRAIDRDGQLIDSMPSEKREKHAARRFLRRLVDVAEGRPLPRHVRPPPRLPARGPFDPRAARSAPAPAVLEQLHGARPPWGEAAVLPNARLRELRVCGALLLGV